MSAAGCKVTNYKGKSREHVADLATKIKYDSSPPTEGSHYQEAAEDGAYDQAPDAKQLVHALEHGRIVIWVKKGLPKDDRAGLKALFDEDSYQTILTPDPTGMRPAGGGQRVDARPDAQRHRSPPGVPQVRRRGLRRPPRVQGRISGQRPRSGALDRRQGDRLQVARSCKVSPKSASGRLRACSGPR
ncbi:MAG: DUF3105 domain-containing protein [Thermoleophilaceae bacterium]